MKTDDFNDKTELLTGVASSAWLGVIVVLHIIIFFCLFMGAWNVIQAGILLAKAERNLKKADDDKRRRKPVKPDCKFSDG